MIGAVKYLSEYPSEPTKKLTCYLLDGEQAWADTWTEIADSIETSVSVNVNFQPLDVSEPSSWSAQKKFLQADLFTLSYFVSEVYSVKPEVVTTFWKKLFDEAKVGALFLYVDNGSEVFNTYFDAQWNERGDIKAVVQATDTLITPRFSEQASELGDYLSKFDQQPKLKSRISYRILRKTS